MCTAFSSIACADNSADNRDRRIVAIYGTYVAYAEENDITPLSYEEWLESVKGQNGKDGIDGVNGKDGNDGKDGRGIVKAEISDTDLIIYYTDGTKDTLDLSGIIVNPSERNYE